MDAQPPMAFLVGAAVGPPSFAPDPADVFFDTFTCKDYFNDTLLLFSWFVIIVAVGCSLIYRRCRESHNFSISTPASPAGVPTRRGLEQVVVQSLPSFVFSQPHSGYDRLECVICLAEFEDGEKVRALPNCGHCFHTCCIDRWFKTRDSCPVCRAPLDPQNFKVAVYN